MSLPAMPSTNAFTRRDETARETRRRLNELRSARGTVNNSGFVLDHAEQTIQNTADIVTLDAMFVAQAALLAEQGDTITDQASVISNLVTLVDQLEQRIVALEAP